jgi:ubiquinone/menaquinone biosynthesis C-methylase UbiE
MTASTERVLSSFDSTNKGPSDGGAPDGFLQLLDMIQCYRVAQPIHVAAVLGIADLVADVPLSVDEIGSRTDTHADSLYRMLRVLACAGIFTELSDRRFGLTVLGNGLREGGPLRALAMLLGGVHYRAWGDLLETVRTGEPAFPRVFGRPFLEYLSSEPALQDVVNRSMTGLMEETIAAMTSSYDFAGVNTLVDVGGGQGRFVRALLEMHSIVRAIVVDFPPVAAAARKMLDSAGVGERAQTVGCDFFTGLPAGGDVYMLSRILQGLDDQRARAVLQRCADVLPPGGRVIVAEMVITSEHSTLTAGEDLHMMLVTTGGRIRTEQEHRDLLDATGFRLSRVIPTASTLPFTMIEGVRL